MEWAIITVCITIVVSIIVTVLVRSAFPDKPVAIEVLPVTGGGRMGDWIARLSDQHGTWEIASTQTEAMGKLMISLETLGKVKIIYVEEG